MPDEDDEGGVIEPGDAELDAFFGLDKDKWHPDEWRATLRSQKTRTATWHTYCLWMLEIAYRRHKISPNFFLQLAGIMVQVAENMDQVIYIDQNVRRIDPAGVVEITDGWKELVNRRAYAIEAATMT